MIDESLWPRGDHTDQRTGIVYREPKPGYVFDSLGACRGCGAPMAWWITLLGRRSPHDADGTSHFATCPVAGSFRR